MNETKEQQKFNYCHGDSLPIMGMDVGDEADVWIAGRTLEVSAIDTSGTYINFCPKCGRKLN